MPRQSLPDQYVFTFDATGVVTSVAEVEKNGRLDYEKIERGESYRLIDGFVVKTEIDGREQEWTVYGDAGNGRWIELGEGDGAFDVSLLQLFGAKSPEGEAPAPIAVTGGDAYVFHFNAAGVVTMVFEVEKNGRLDYEKIERGESYVLQDGFVVKSEIDDGRLEQTWYADPDGDGVWVEIAQVTPAATSLFGAVAW